MASTLKVNIVGDAKKFTKATKTAENSLSKLGKSGFRTAKVLKSALGAVGLAVGFRELTNQFSMATKAAIEDTKSQALLARQLQNTVGATKMQTAAVEDQITKLSLLSAIPDDEIRPAYAQLLRSTKSVTKATRLTSLALDVSAGTGKDVASVSKALSKAYGGNTGALSKMGINVKKGGNWMKELKKQFSGMAEVQARQDPLKRMNTTFGELQEKLGQGFIPVLNRVADWFDANYENIAKFFTDAWNSDAVKMLKDMLKSLWENVLVPFGKWITSKEVQDAFKKISIGFSNLVVAVQDFSNSDIGKALGKLASKATIDLLNAMGDALNYISLGMERMAGNQKGAASGKYYTWTGWGWQMSDIPQGGDRSGLQTGLTPQGKIPASPTNGSAVTLNIYPQTMNAKEVEALMNKYGKQTGRGRLAFQ